MVRKFSRIYFKGFFIYKKELYNKDIMFISSDFSMCLTIYSSSNSVCLQMDRELPRANLQVPFDLAAPVKADWDTGSYYALRSSVLTGLFDVQGSKELFTAGTARNVADDLHVPAIVATLQSTSTFFEPYNTVTIVSINLKEPAIVATLQFIIDVVQGGSVQGIPFQWPLPKGGKSFQSRIHPSLRSV
jgi:hypothetical protein